MGGVEYFLLVVHAFLAAITCGGEHCTFGTDRFLTVVAAQAGLNVGMVGAIENGWRIGHREFPVDGF